MSAPGDETRTAAADESRAEPGLRARVVRATSWSVAAYGVGFAIRVGSNLVLTRLLTPDDFGLMTLLSIVIAGLYLLSDFGVTPCVVRSPRGDEPTFRDTAWTLTLVRGSALFVIACVLAYPTSRFYDEPDLAYLIPALAGGSLFIGSFRSIKVVAAERHLNARRVSLFELVSQIVTVVVTIIWAYLWPSIWALVGGAIISSSLHVMLSFTMFPGRNDRLCWDRSSLTELLGFGRWVFLSTGLMFLAGQTDRVILSQFVTFATLGVVGIGLQLAEMPRQLLTRLCNQVLLPAMSKVMDRPRDELRQLIEKQRRRALPLAAVVLALGFSLSDVAVNVLYDDRYAAAGWVVAVMLLSTWIALLSMSVDPALIALGKPKYVAIANACVMLVNFVGVPLGFLTFGLVGAIGAMAAKQLAYYAVICVGLRRTGLGLGLQDARMTFLFVGLLAAMGGLRLLLGLGHPLTLALSG